jgi:hypothetical protein
MPGLRQQVQLLLLWLLQLLLQTPEMLLQAPHLSNQGVHGAFPCWICAGPAAVLGPEHLLLLPGCRWLTVDLRLAG